MINNLKHNENTLFSVHLIMVIFFLMCEQGIYIYIYIKVLQKYFINQKYFKAKMNEIRRNEMNEIRRKQQKQVKKLKVWHISIDTFEKLCRILLRLQVSLNKQLGPQA